MKKVCIVGHYAFGKNLINGQTIKTQVFTNGLMDHLGRSEVCTIDTHGGAKSLIRCFFQIGKAFMTCKNIIMFPAQNGVKIFSPVMLFWRFLFNKRIHYVVIGGWLPELLKSNNILSSMLKKFDGIYVETNTMKNALHQQGFKNIFVIPNFKDIKVITKEELVYSTCEPYKLCTFSRVMKEKGIDKAVKTVIAINNKFNRIVYTLDIYGQIDTNQTEWFKKLQASFPEYIKYKGAIPFDQSVNVLKNYYVLLFPTQFYTEGIPGTIIDAYAAGIPVVSSRWESFMDIIEDQVTGIGYDFYDENGLENILLNYTMNYSYTNIMKEACLLKAYDFSKEKVLKTIIKRL